jgi:hypothetical protein
VHHLPGAVVADPGSHVGHGAQHVVALPLLLLLLLLPLLLLLQAPPSGPSHALCCHHQQRAATPQLACSSVLVLTLCCPAGGKDTSRQHPRAPWAVSLSVLCSSAAAAAAHRLLCLAAETPAAAPGGMGRQVVVGSRRGHSTGAGRPANVVGEAGATMASQPSSSGLVPPSSKEHDRQPQEGMRSP